MPKPLKVDQKIECEIRKRDYMKAFDSYVIEISSSKLNPNENIDGSAVNLTKYGLRGLKSLKKRMKRGNYALLNLTKALDYVY